MDLFPKKIQPLGVNRSCTFIIDFDSVCLEDLKSDDVGSWKGNGTRRSYFTLKHNKAEFIKAVPSQIGAHYVIIRRYFMHSTYNKFRRTIIEIRGMEVHVLYLQLTALCLPALCLRLSNWQGGCLDYLEGWCTSTKN